MNCNRCEKSGCVLKTIYLPQGGEMNICKKCQQEVDQGGKLTLNKPMRAPRLSRMAREMRRLDEENVAVVNDNSLEEMQKMSIAAQQPFPSSWKKNKEIEKPQVETCIPV